MRTNHVIIGGAPKSGTSAVFKYLSAHPEVSPSSIKETAFFIECDDSSVDVCRKEYDTFFSTGKMHKVLLETSTGYLGYSSIVAPKIQKVLNSNVKFIFILRNPIDKIYSYYWYSVGRGDFPESLSFSDYIAACLRYESDGVIEHGLKEYDVLMLQHGKYAENLNRYIKAFGKNNVKILSFDSLSADPRSFMFDISDFIGIDRYFFDGYEFTRVNVSQTAKLKLVHAMALRFNKTFEPILRKYPMIKDFLKRSYQKTNIKRTGYENMKKAEMQMLSEYYKPSLIELYEIVNGKDFSWMVE